MISKSSKLKVLNELSTLKSVKNVLFNRNKVQPLSSSKIRFYRFIFHISLWKVFVFFLTLNLTNSVLIDLIDLQMLRFVIKTHFFKKRFDNQFRFG